MIYFRNYGRRKRCSNKCPKKSCLRGHFDNRHVQPEEALLKCAWRHVYHIYWCLWRQFGRKKSLWLICKLLKVFLNALTVCDNYPFCNRDNLQEPFQMPLSYKQESFPESFFAFLKSTLNFEHFPKKEHPHSCFISEITDAEKGV